MLNPTATWLWELLATPSTSDDLVSALCSRYAGLTADRAGADLATLLDDLLRHGVVVRGT